MEPRNFFRDTTAAGASSVVFNPIPCETQARFTARLGIRVLRAKCRRCRPAREVIYEQKWKQRIN